MQQKYEHPALAHPQYQVPLGASLPRNTSHLGGHQLPAKIRKLPLPVPTINTKGTSSITPYLQRTNCAHAFFLQLSPPMVKKISKSTLNLTHSSEATIVATPATSPIDIKLRALLSKPGPSASSPSSSPSTSSPSPTGP